MSPDLRTAIDRLLGTCQEVARIYDGGDFMVTLESDVGDVRDALDVDQPPTQWVQELTEHVHVEVTVSESGLVFDLYQRADPIVYARLPPEPQWDLQGTTSVTWAMVIGSAILGRSLGAIDEPVAPPEEDAPDAPRPVT